MLSAPYTRSERAAAGMPPSAAISFLRLRVNSRLKLESEPKLHLPAEPGARDAAEIAGTDLKRRRIEGRCIREVVVFPSELDLFTFADGKILEDREVEIRQPGSKQYIPAAVSIMAAGQQECVCVEPPLQGPLTGIEIPVGEAVRAAVAAWAAVINGRHALCGMHGQTSFQAESAIQLPAAQHLASEIPFPSIER